MRRRELRKAEPRSFIELLQKSGILFSLLIIIKIILYMFYALYIHQNV